MLGLSTVVTSVFCNVYGMPLGTIGELCSSVETCTISDLLIAELACVSIFISVLLLLATCFVKLFTGKSKSVLIVDLYVQNPALLNGLYILTLGHGQAGDLGLGVDLHGVGVCANIRLLLLTFGVSLSVNSFSFGHAS